MPDMSGAMTMASLTSFNFAGLEMLHSLLLPLVLVLTISDAAAPSIADGGSRYKFLYNFGFTAMITGFCLVCLPVLAGILFSAVEL
jgi:archaellum biogenesis protein FlaJ (TadC family)